MLDGHFNIGFLRTSFLAEVTKITRTYFSFLYVDPICHESFL